jgi:hypothetical protein
MVWRAKRPGLRGFGQQKEWEWVGEALAAGSCRGALFVWRVFIGSVIGLRSWHGKPAQDGRAAVFDELHDFVEHWVRVACGSELGLGLVGLGRHALGHTLEFFFDLGG